ncbi:MAG: amino acid permease [Candidatus Diapherotrites archaeon]|nr:amino acid permease [Candidatus Diapherotrites archaeon]
MALKRVLTFPELLAYGVGIILGAGIYVLIGSAAGMAGNLLWVSFLIAGIVAAFSAFSFAELSSMFPVDGAQVVYVKRAFGSPALAWLMGFLTILAGAATAGTVGLGFANYLNYFVGFSPLLLAAVLVLVMSGLNFWGVKESSAFNLVSTAVEAVGLLLVIVFGIGFLGSINYFELPAGTDAWSAVFPVMSASALIFFAYIGFESIATLGEETVDAARTVPKALLGSLAICTLLYLLVGVVAISVVPAAELGASPQPLVRVMEVLLGGLAVPLIAVIALFATSNTVLVSLVTTSRLMYGMGEDGELPRALTRLHPKRETPWIAIGVIALFSLLLLGFNEITVLASITNFGIFVAFFFVNAANIVLRIRSPQLVRPYRAPLNAGNIPILSVLGCLTCLLLIFSLTEPLTLLGFTLPVYGFGFIVSVLGLGLYYLFFAKEH